MRPRDYSHDTIRQIQYRIYQPSSQNPLAPGYWTLLSLHAVPDSSRTDTKTIQDKASVHTKDGGFDAISLTERSCATLILKLDRHISDRLMRTGIGTVAEVNEWERELEPSETEVNIQK